MQWRGDRRRWILFLRRRIHHKRVDEGSVRHKNFSRGQLRVREHKEQHDGMISTCSTHFRKHRGTEFRLRVAADVLIQFLSSIQNEIMREKKTGEQIKNTKCSKGGETHLQPFFYLKPKQDLTNHQYHTIPKEYFLSQQNLFYYVFKFNTDLQELPKDRNINILSDPKVRGVGSHANLERTSQRHLQATWRNINWQTCAGQFSILLDESPCDR